MNRRISKELAYFLKKNKIYTNFLRYARNVDDPLLTISSLDWKNTVEGYVFWKGVSIEYNEYLRGQIDKLMEDYFKNQNIVWRL